MGPQTGRSTNIVSSRNWNIQVRRTDKNSFSEKFQIFYLNKRFLTDAFNVCQYYVDHQRSPQGRTHYLQWGSLRYAANAAFICLQASDLTKDKGKSETFRKYALGQMEYMLGSTGRSFVVGFGTNPPTQPHHASSSCPVDPNETCDWDDYNSPDPNPHVLYGALVGG